MTRNNADFQAGIVHVPIHEVNEFIPNDFRDDDMDNPIRMKHIDEDTFVNSGEESRERYIELRKSIAKQGVLEPIQAAKLSNGNTLLVNGHHRAVYARETGQTHVPVEYEE